MKKHYLQQTGIFEGWEPEIYLCPTGHLTIGYGHNLESQGMSKEMIRVLFKGFRQSQESSLKLLELDMEEAVKDAEHFLEDPLYVHGESSLTLLSKNRQYVISDMAFNMGEYKLSKFINTRKEICRSIKTGDFNPAADEMKDSRWYRQTGNRAIFLVDLMRTDVWKGVAEDVEEDA